jgi:hypothetical protein
MTLRIQGLMNAMGRRHRKLRQEAEGRLSWKHP